MKRSIQTEPDEAFPIGGALRVGCAQGVPTLGLYRKGDPRVVTC